MGWQQPDVVCDNTHAQQITVHLRSPFAHVNWHVLRSFFFFFAAEKTWPGNSGYCNFYFWNQRRTIFQTPPDNHHGPRRRRRWRAYGRGSRTWYTSAPHRQNAFRRPRWCTRTRVFRSRRDPTPATLRDTAAPSSYATVLPDNSPWPRARLSSVPLDFPSHAIYTPNA